MPPIHYSVNIRGNIGLFGFIAMLLSTILAAAFLQFHLLPEKYIYEILFGPSTVVGLATFFYIFGIILFRIGIMPAFKVFCFTIAVFGIANFIDSWLIYFEAWNFPEGTHYWKTSLFWLPQTTFFGNPIQIPFMEVWGFNMIITWIIIFLSALILSYLTDLSIKIEDKKGSGNTITFQ